MLLADDLQLVTPGPPQVTGFGAQVVGIPGLRQYWYWVVANYPIGPSLAGPIFVSNAPDTLDADNYVQLVWQPAIAALGYDVLRTDVPQFPSGPGSIALATGITDTQFPDQGTPPIDYAPAGLPFGAPAIRTVRLNNRDYAEPTIELDAMRVSSITFPDGTTSTTGGGSQTPWTSNIDGNNFQLNNASMIMLTNTSAPGAQLYLDPQTATIRLSCPNAPIAQLQLLGNFNCQFQMVTNFNSQAWTFSQINTGFLRITSSLGTSSGLVINLAPNSPTVLNCDGSNVTLASPGNLTLNPSGNLIIPNLLSVNPGSGWKMLWYDPTDGNRVKYAA